MSESTSSTQTMSHKANLPELELLTEILPDKVTLPQPELLTEVMPKRVYQENGSKTPSFKTTFLLNSIFSVCYTIYISKFKQKTSLN